MKFEVINYFVCEKKLFFSNKHFVTWEQDFIYIYLCFWVKDLKSANRETGLVGEKNLKDAGGGWWDKCIIYTPALILFFFTHSQSLPRQFICIKYSPAAVVTLLMAVQGTELGIPAKSAACLSGAWPMFAYHKGIKDFYYLYAIIKALKQTMN